MKRLDELTNKIDREMEDIFDEYNKQGKKYSTRAVMQKVLDKYKSEITSEADKEYVNKFLKYKYFLYTNRQPKDFIFESKMKILDEEIQKMLNEDEENVIRKSHTIHGNPFTETEEGKATVEFLGIPIEYRLIKHEERDKDTNDVVKTRYKIEVAKDSEDIIHRELQKKIEETFKSQLKDLYNVDVTYIGGSSMIGIPINAEYKK